MQRQEIYGTQMEQTDLGELQVWVESAVGAVPVENAKVSVAYSGDPVSTIEELTTDSSGRSQEIELATPPLEYSMQPDSPQPYAEYTVRVEAEGFQSVDVSGVEVFSGTEAIQNIRLRPLENVEEPLQNIVIPANTLFGDYPPKIAEAEIKPVTESGEIVLSRVVIPEYVVVHDGSPRDNTAQDYYIRYKDYIKNVASSEIYATWPDSTIRANILAIMSFTLNRVYTEWYRNRGYNFTITSSTAYDHKWIYGRNIFENISRIVDEMFGNYLSRPNVKQPILTQYCDGQKVSCPNWMTKWRQRIETAGRNVMGQKFGKAENQASAAVKIDGNAVFFFMIDDFFDDAFQSVIFFGNGNGGGPEQFTDGGNPPGLGVGVRLPRIVRVFLFCQLHFQGGPFFF